MSLTIVKHSETQGIKMSINDLNVHRVHNPDMNVLAKINAKGQLWPEILRHNGQEYHFVSSEPVQQMLESNYSGYALYRIKIS